MSIGRVPGATGIQPSIVDAKGDIIAATAADSVSRLAVGTNNQVLTADSAEATGLKYANEARATLTTTGDILYASAANTPARLGIGSTGQVLTVSGGVPAWGAASGGLTLITNQAFTTVSSYSLPANTFSATYNNYEIILDVTAFSANNTLGARLRSGSTDYSDGQYLYQELSATGGSASANTAATGNTSIQVGDVNSATNYQMKMTLFKPNVTIKKWYFVDSIQYTSAGVWKYIKGSGRIDTASAYDSMSFIPSSGTMTGRVYVYGYNI